MLPNQIFLKHPNTLGFVRHAPVTRSQFAGLALAALRDPRFLDAVAELSPTAYQLGFLAGIAWAIFEYGPKKQRTV